MMMSRSWIIADMVGWLRDDIDLRCFHHVAGGHSLVSCFAVKCLYYNVNSRTTVNTMNSIELKCDVF